MQAEIHINQLALNDGKQMVTAIRRTYRAYRLTQRESECFFCILRGMSIKKIARVLEISSRTVEKFIISLKVKLNCYYKGDLVERAFNDGLLCIRTS